MRVWLDVQANVLGTIPVAVPWYGNATVTVDHDALRRETLPLLLELEVSDAGEVSMAWLGPEGALESIPLELAQVLIGKDSPELRVALLLMRENHAKRALAHVAVRGDEATSIHPALIGKAGIDFERETGCKVVGCKVVGGETQQVRP